MNLYRSGLAIMVMALFATGCSQAPQRPIIRVENVWSRPVQIENTIQNGPQQGKNKTMGMRMTGVVYLTLVNDGGAADRLVSVSTDVSETAEIHLSKTEDNNMKMMRLEGGLEIPPGGKIEFKPGGYHMMLVDMKQSLRKNDRFAITLEFENSGPVVINSVVKEN